MELLIFTDLTSCILPFIYWGAIYGSYHFFKFAATEKIKTKKEVRVIDRIFGHLQGILCIAVASFCFTILTDHTLENYINWNLFIVLSIPSAVGIEAAVAKYSKHTQAVKKEENEIDKLLKQNSENREALRREIASK